MYKYSVDQTFMQDSFINVILWRALESQRNNEIYLLDISRAKEILERREKPMIIEQYFGMIQEIYHNHCLYDLIKYGVYIEYNEGDDIVEKMSELYGMNKFVIPEVTENINSETTEGMPEMHYNDELPELVKTMFQL